MKMQEALLKEMDNWLTYYPMRCIRQMIDEMLHH